MSPRCKARSELRRHNQARAGPTTWCTSECADRATNLAGIDAGMDQVDRHRRVECPAGDYGVSAVAIQSMTLQSYDTRALSFKRFRTSLIRHSHSGRCRVRSFCPRCLGAAQACWQLGWRLGWSFLYVEHRCLLVDGRPNCGKHQRRQQNYSRTSTPSKCACGCDLIGFAATVPHWGNDLG